MKRSSDRVKTRAPAMRETTNGMTAPSAPVVDAGPSAKDASRPVIDRMRHAKAGMCRMEEAILRMWDSVPAWRDRRERVKKAWPGMGW